MIVLLLTHEPDHKHLVTKNDADGAYKIYYQVEDDADIFDQAVKDHTVFRVYHRKTPDTNFAYLGDTEYAIFFNVEDKGPMLNLFFPSEQVKKRTLFASANAYVDAVAKECGFDGEVAGTFFVVSRDTSLCP